MNFSRQVDGHFVDRARSVWPLQIWPTFNTSATHRCSHCSNFTPLSLFVLVLFITDEPAMWKEGWLIKISLLTQVEVLQKAARCQGKYWHWHKCSAISSNVRSAQGIFCSTPNKSFDEIKICRGAGAVDRFHNLNSALLCASFVVNGKLQSST